MRLTLRTLLAYLDDILDAATTKEIGARVSENTTASNLIARIRDVTRRRRIGSPELSGPGSTPEPNVVAEYLDNTLDPGAVADLERVCLESDVHLAEVAACHQILTIVLGEPVTIRPELRERMYAMGSATPGPAPSTVPANTPYAVGSAPLTPARPVVPDYLKRPPLWKRLVPLAALGVLAAGWLWLVMTSGLFEGGQKVAKDADKPKAAPLPAPDKVRPAPQVEQPRLDEPQAPSPAVSPMDVAATPAPMTPEASTTTTADTAPAFTPNADTAVAAVTAPMAPSATAPPATGIEAPPVDQRPQPTIMYTSAEGVLLHRPRGRQEWTVLPRRALLRAGDEIASPEPFVSELQLTSPTDQGITLRMTLGGGHLQEGARIRILPPTETMLAEIEIDRGRIAIHRPTDGVTQAIGLGVTVAGKRTEFDAVMPQTRFGLEVDLPRAKGGPPAADQWPQRTGTLTVVQGVVNVRRDRLPPISGEPGLLTLEWTNAAVDAFSAGLGIPPWLDTEIRPLASQKNWAQKFEAEFALDQSVVASIEPVVEDKRNTIAAYATKTMALVDNPSVLVRTLTSPHDDARHAAMIGLREWVLLTPDNVPRLTDEVSRAFRDPEVPIVEKLLWRLSDAELRDETASMQVLEWLSSDNLAIRDLAFYEVLEATSRDFQYRPQAPVNQRESSIARLREHIRRTKGLIAPVPAEAPPAENM
jgi:hypothetical protein